MHVHPSDSIFMKRALELALLGIGSVSPNPLVGSVIVHNGKIIGEGWHQQYGKAHAEVNAIASVEDKSLLNESTLYVNLEPCSHYGKTPPCTDLLITHKLKRVVIANLDSNPVVAGKGIEKLKEAGVEVAIGIREAEGRELNKRFFTFIEKARPYMILKWAQTADGFIAHENYDSKWISNELSRQLTHKWRSEEDAILVGSKTALFDNPRLNVRDWTGRDPIRIVVDRYNTLPSNLHLFNQQQPTICYNLKCNEQHPNLSYVKIDEENFFTNVIADLYKQRIQSVLVEGGATTLSLLIENNLWDEARIFISSTEFTKGIPAPSIKGTILDEKMVGNDRLKILKRTCTNDNGQDQYSG